MPDDVIDRVSLDVLGTPAPKGSSRAVMRGGRAINVPSGSNVNRDKLADWGGAVRAAVLAKIGERSAPVFQGEALSVTIVFRLARPAGHWSKKPGGGLLPSAPKFHTTKPDASKLARSTEDAMIGSVYDDDSRIVGLHLFKQFALPGREGAFIIVERAKVGIEAVREMENVLRAANQPTQERLF